MISSAAVIVSDFGDFSRFANPNKMLSFLDFLTGYIILQMRRKVKV